jgi:GNAT superfamily N-acetyltransferase
MRSVIRSTPPAETLVMLIREASLEDCVSIGALFEQVDAMHATVRPEMFRRPERPVWTREAIEKLLASPTDNLFVAAQDGRLVGLVRVITRSSPALGIFVRRRFAIVETLVVAEEARRRGVGRGLMAHLQDWATNHGLQEVPTLCTRVQCRSQSVLCRTRV